MSLRDTVLGRTGLKVKTLGFGGIPIQRISEAAEDRKGNQEIEKNCVAGVIRHTPHLVTHHTTTPHTTHHTSHTTGASH